MDTASISGSESSDCTLKPIPRERAFLETFFYTLGQFQFDRAHEIIEKEKDKFKPTLGTNWMSLINLLLNLAYAEKQYFTMAFIEKKLFKQTIRPLYASLLTDLSKQSELNSKSTRGIEALAIDLSKQLGQFINARLKMIGIYESMAKSGCNTDVIVKEIQDISHEYSKDFHHPILDPSKTSFTYEVDIIITLFQAEQNLSEWKFLESLLLLRDIKSKLHAWCLLSPSPSVKEQLLASFSYKSFFSRNSKHSNELPFLFQWLYQLFSDVYSKFSFYFYSTLSSQAPLADIKASCSKLSIDFISKLQVFQKKTDAFGISLVLDTAQMKAIFCGHGYHLDNTIREKPTGMNSFPSVVNIPNIWRKEHWPNVISILDDHQDSLKVTDKIVYFYDSKLESSYFLIRVDRYMTLVIIYNVKKKERDTYIQGVLTEIRASLGHDRLYYMLRPGQAKTF